MKFIDYSEVEVTCEAKEFVKVLKGRFVDNLISEYNNLILDFCRNGVRRNIEIALDSLEKICSLLGIDLTSVRILDLGCGTAFLYGGDNVATQTYAPWLCRIIHSLGGNVVGVDIGPLDGEIFPYRNIDLLTREIGLEDGSINLVHARGLLTSPRLGGLEIGVHVLSMENARQEVGQKFLDILKPQLRRIVKEEGYFLHYDSISNQYDFR